MDEISKSIHESSMGALIPIVGIQFNQPNLIITANHQS